MTRASLFIPGQGPDSPEGRILLHLLSHLTTPVLCRDIGVTPSSGTTTPEGSLYTLVP